MRAPLHGTAGGKHRRNCGTLVQRHTFTFLGIDTSTVDVGSWVSGERAFLDLRPNLKKLAALDDLWVWLLPGALARVEAEASERVSETLLS